MSAVAQQIRDLVKAGRTKDVLALMLGESPYTSSQFQGSPENRMLGRAWSMALHYLQFVSEFGLTTELIEREGKAYRGYPEDFEKWLELGAPGIIEAELNEYIRDNPLA